MRGKLQTSEDSFVVRDGLPSDGATQFEQRKSAGDEGRSAQKVALWSSYLPQDCVDKMLEMGWDKST